MPLLNRLTLARQWAFVICMAVLPLLGAVVYAAHHLHKQAMSQRKLALDIGAIYELNNALEHQLEKIERSARQYQLLQDSRFLVQFEQNLQLIETFLSQSAIALQQDSVDLSQNLHQLAQTVASLTPETPAEVLQAELASSKIQLDALHAALTNKLQNMLDQHEAKFDQVITHIMLIGAIALPGTLLLVVVASIAITRPVKRLILAIRQLGHGHWQHPIAINGPADLRALGSHLEWMRNRLDAGEKQKHAFLRHITHELKTPLAAIVEAGSLLRDQVPGPINQAQLQVLGILTTNADNLRTLIQQLLNYNAASHGIQTQEIAVDLVSLCTKIRTKLMESRPTSRCTWKLHGEPLTLSTDPQAMDMILSNLFSNAHDFAPPNGTIQVDWGKEVDHWWLSVSDNGPGMTPEERANIFKPFYQGKARRKGALQGTGLGLAIVHECVTQLSGTVDVASGAWGSEFRLRFPLG